MYWQIYHVLSKLSMQTQLEEVPGCGQDLKREIRVDLDPGWPPCSLGLQVASGGCVLRFSSCISRLYCLGSSLGSWVEPGSYCDMQVILSVLFPSPPPLPSNGKNHNFLFEDFMRIKQVTLLNYLNTLTISTLTDSLL